MKKLFILVSLTAFLTICHAQTPKQEQVMTQQTISLSINNQTFDLQLENNQTAQRFAEILPLDLKMSDHLQNEKYATLPTSLTTNDKTAGQIHAGDVMLYQGDTMVIFYESFNSRYRYTKIGKITPTDNLKNALGKNDVAVIIKVAK